jgi:hypothetical protein
MILVEIQAAIDAAGTLTTLCLADSHFTTSPSDTPANTSFIQALSDPGSIGVHAYSDGKTTGGATKLETGEIVVVNVGGRFDDWLDYGFDGRTVTIRYGEGGRYPEDFQTLFTGTLEGQPEVSFESLVFRLRDKQYLFSVPALITRYAGSNVLPLGFEGVPADVMGKVKPRVFGTVFNVSPVQVNTSKMTYQVSEGALASIGPVYDGGLALTFGADFATKELLQASTPASGAYNTCLAEGFFQLGANPSGLVTADAVQGASAGDRTVAQILRRLAAIALPSAEISAGDVAALDAISSGVAGIWLGDESTTILSAMDLVAASIGAWYGFDESGVLRMGVLTEPSGDPVFDIHDFHALEGIERRPARDNGVPVWRVTLKYARIWTVQTSGLLGAVMPDRRAYLALASRSVVWPDTDVKRKHLLATDMVVDGVLAYPADAAVEADRQLQLQKKRRDIFDVPISLNSLMGRQPVQLMRTGRLTIPRFQLNNGKLFRVIGRRLELASKKIIFTVWG